MLFAIDIGNTSIVAGVFDSGLLKSNWRFSTASVREPEQCRIVFSDLLTHADLGAGDITGVVVCSVVPSIEETLTGVLEELIGVKPLMVGTDLVPAMPITTDDATEVGADRIANAVAAFDRYKTSLIVVDLGTAVTFDYVTERGEYAGGAIAPGIGVSVEALTNRAEKLSAVEIKRPERVVGTNTDAALASGVFYGFVGLIDGVIERMREEVGGEPRVIATGGDARLMAAESAFVTEVDEFLTLKGLRLIYEARS